MKTLIQKTRYFRPIGSKALAKFAFVSALSVLSISPALANHDNGHCWGNRGRDYNRYGYQRGYHDYDHDDYGGTGKDISNLMATAISNPMATRNQSMSRRQCTIRRSNHPA